jgi:uncharacterized membrane protein YsdA (DUF1294 family)
MLEKYLLGINILEFLLMGIDKYRAIHNGWRIPEKALFIIAFLGGSLGGILGMIIFHHKTKKKSFQVLFSIFLLLTIILYLKK